MATAEAGGAVGWVLAAVATLGYPGLALLVALETFVPPIPSELVLPASGFLVSQGRFSFWGALLSATLGSVVGSLALFLLARGLGAERVDRFVARHGRWVGVDGDDVARADGWFRRRGDWVVLVGRLVPALRSLVSIPAGLYGMPLWRFTLLTALGSLAWNAVLIFAGWRLGESWSLIGPWLDRAGWAVWSAVALLVAWWVARRVRDRRRAERSREHGGRVRTRAGP